VIVDVVPGAAIVSYVSGRPILASLTLARDGECTTLAWELGPATCEIQRVALTEIRQRIAGDARLGFRDSVICLELASARVK